MLLGTLGTSLLENILTGRGINRAVKGWGWGKNRAVECAIATRQSWGIVRAGYGSLSSKIDF